MDVNISLGSFTMNDERKEETRITRLLDKKVSICYLNLF